jgi:hypothetical protein
MLGCRLTNKKNIALIHNDLTMHVVYPPCIFKLLARAYVPRLEWASLQYNATVFWPKPSVGWKNAMETHSMFNLVQNLMAKVIFMCTTLSLSQFFAINLFF